MVNTSKNYIGPLDGLRAIAILSVLIFHLNERFLPGGFVGVDIFFTISGFIITRNILLQLDQDNFNLFSFYHRRIVRLLPAVAVTVSLSLVAAMQIYSPEAVAGYARAGLYSIASVANVFFWLNSGYFDDSSQSNLFLHMWSLSVEEQFYFFWPLLLMMVYPLIKLSANTLLVILIFSLGLSWYLSTYYPAAGFYLMPARIFQFAIGAIAAWISLNSKNRFDSLRQPIPANTIFSFGLFLILASTTLASGKLYNFLIAFILPVIGASLVILSIESSLSIFLLGNRLSRYIGQRAYSLYLVHWPLFVFSTLFYGADKPVGVYIVLLIACAALAETLYQTVERPFRLVGIAKRDQYKTAGAVVVTILSILVVAHFWALNLPQVSKSDSLSENRSLATVATSSTSLYATSVAGVDARDLTVSYASYTSQLWKDRGRLGKIDAGCQLGSKAPYIEYSEVNCVPATGSKDKILVIGDSYTAEVRIMMAQVFKEEQLISAGTSGCWPIYPETNTPNRSNGCKTLNANRFEWIYRDDVSAIVIVSNWRHWKPAQVRGTLKKLMSAGKPIILVGARPSFTTRIVTLLDSNIAENVAYDLNKYNGFNTEQVDAMLKDVITHSAEGVYFLDLMRFLCPYAKCMAFTEQGSLIYLDNAHISADAAIQIGQQIKHYLGPEIYEHVERVYTADEKQTAVSGVANTSVSLQCAGLNGGPKLYKYYVGYLSKNIFTLEDGQREQQGFTEWRGNTLPNGNLLIEGTYIEGPGGAKSLRFEAEPDAKNGYIGQGLRGPRSCTLTIQPI